MEAIDRRTLMRRAGVVGAVAWSAPLILDSLTSPAAAMSGQTVTVASLGAFTDASSDAATISAGPFASSTVGHSVPVLVSTRQQTLTPTLSIGAGGPIASPVLLATVTYVVGATRTWTLWAYLATGTGAAGNFDVMCNSSRNLAVSVLQVDGEDTGAPIATSVIANGNPVVTMTQYDQTFGLPVAFEPFSMARIVAEVLADAGMSTLRTAETEKYPHVTYFFNGGNEVPYRGEERILVPSQKVATYDLMPEMSAPGITDVLVKAIEGRTHEFTLCNYANGDMVGHSGNIAATIRACECVDEQLTRIVAAAARSGARLLVTADHGNCEMMIDPKSGGPHTAHTTNPVPLVLVDESASDATPLRAGGALCDIGPTVLSMLGVGIPSEMTGKDLRPSGVPA
jgi:hypothetical protein